MARPTTSSSRPYTAGGESLSGWTESDAPSSSHGPASYAYPTAYYGQGHQHQQIEEEEEEDEESEDEDVFAYVPPTTADSNQQQQQQQIQQQLLQQQQQLQHHQQQQGGSLPTTTSTHTPAQMHHLAAAAGLISESPPPDHRQTYPHPHHQLHQSSPSPDQYDVEAPPDHFIMKPLGSPGSGNETPVRVTLPNTRSGVSSGPNSPSLHKRISDQSLTHTQPYSSTRQNTGVTHTKFDDVELMDEDEDDSPYPEVRASVSNIDDPDMPALTFRVWVLGLLLCILGAGLNTFFNFRYPAPFVQPLLCL